MRYNKKKDAILILEDGTQFNGKQSQTIKTPLLGKFVSTQV